jgi:GNAT superfamily N-acetyltransferase
MTSPDQLNRRGCAVEGLELRQVSPPLPELNRCFYTTIGSDWFWLDRLAWTLDDWRTYLGREGVETWLLSSHEFPAGYFELDAQPGGDVEIVYFGLLPLFTGKGLGGHLLTCAVDRAWSMGGRRVWLHTCSLDDPRALPHYLARGFELYKQEESVRMLPISRHDSRTSAMPPVASSNSI